MSAARDQYLGGGLPLTGLQLVDVIIIAAVISAVGLLLMWIARP